MNNQSEKKLVRIAIALILIILLLSITALFVMNRSGSSGTKIAKIYQDGTLLYTIDLNQVTESYELTITGENGAFNEILVEPGYISMNDASCPDHLCVHVGKINSPALPITCLPNKVVISIFSAADESPDSVAY